MRCCTVLLMLALSSSRAQNFRTSVLFGDNVNLEWIAFPGSIPNGAVRIYNDDARRYDYVCKYNCEAGFYNPALGPKCHYPWLNQELLASSFDILVNKDDFEILEWKDGSYGSAPANSVRTCTNKLVYVGKNQYGLGKVVPQHQAFFLAYNQREMWYKQYQVLTINSDAYRQQVRNVRYAINQAKVFQEAPHIMTTSIVTNNECRSVTKTVTLTTVAERRDTWNIGRGSKRSISASITAGIPEFMGTLSIGGERTKQVDEGWTVVDNQNHAVSVQQQVAPNTSCRVRMEGRRATLDIPYTAQLGRTYSNSRVRWTNISSTYRGVRVHEVRSVVERCEPVRNAQACR